MLIPSQFVRWQCCVWLTAPPLYPGADFMMIPSRFEPCGLIQLHAMQYGTVPLVSTTGGLVDTVKDGVTGFHLGKMDPDKLLDKDAQAVAQGMIRCCLLPHLITLLLSTKVLPPRSCLCRQSVVDRVNSLVIAQEGFHITVWPFVLLPLFVVPCWHDKLELRQYRNTPSVTWLTSS